MGSICCCCKPRRTDSDGFDEPFLKPKFSSFQDEENPDREGRPKNPSTFYGTTGGGGTPGGPGEPQTLRDNVLNEIIDSEGRYLKQLKILFNEFLVPLFNKGIIDSSDKILFTAQLDPIYSFHAQFYKELKASDNIPHLFSTRCDFFKLYTEYIGKYEKILGVLNQYQNNKKFTKFTDEKMQKGQLFESYLIAPVQRIPRYGLLLKELLKYTAHDDPQISDLEIAVVKVNDTAQVINERKRDFENMSKMYRITCKIWGIPEGQSVWDPTRKYLDQAPFSRRSKYDHSKKQPCFLFLFSDCVIITDRTHKFKRLIELKKFMEVVKINSGLRIYVREEQSIELFEHTLNSAKVWVEKLNSAAARSKRRLSSRLTMINRNSGGSPRSKSPGRSNLRHAMSNDSIMQALGEPESGHSSTPEPELSDYEEERVEIRANKSARRTIESRSHLFPTSGGQAAPEKKTNDSLDLDI